MSSGVRAELSPHLNRYSRPNPATPSILRTVAAGALLFLGFAAVGYAQPPCETSPCETIVFDSLRCEDCLECPPGATDETGPDSCLFGAGANDSFKTAAESDGCQDYPQFNLYENWNPAEANKALQVNIRNARWASDADFWYFQIETSETTWDAPFYVASHIEVAFSGPGACGAATRFSLLMTYIPLNTHIGDTWVDTAGVNLFFRRDTNGDVGDEANDGPGVPMASTAEYNCKDDGAPDGGACSGYDTEFSSPPVTAGSMRLRNDAGGQAMVEFAIDRSDLAGFLGLGTGQSSDFVPCDARYWQMQTSTLAGPDHFAWNDTLRDIDLDSTSWAMDNCGTVHSVPVELMKFDID